MPKPHKHTEYSKINQHIYIGTNACCQKHFDKNLLKKDITTGHGRAPTLVAAYFITQGMSTKKAIAFLKTKRAGIHIRPSQLNALKKFKGHL